MSRTSVWVHGEDAISRSGVIAQLRSRSELLVVDDGEAATAEVAVVIVDAVNDACTCLVRNLRESHSFPVPVPVVLVVTDVDDTALMSAVEMGACGVLRRRDATAEHLQSAVLAAVGGGGTLAPDLLGRLMGQMSRLQHDVLGPRGIGPTGVTEREIDVLRLLAEGFGTAEIALKLAYSERTIKNIIHGLTSRLHLRNRLHAVAYAVRAGLI